MTAAKIAHFLILNPQCPRALITCVAGMNNHVGRLAKLYGRSTELQTRLAALQSEIEGLNESAIFDEGLHEFLSRFIRQTSDLAGMVHDTYLSGDLR